MTDYELHCGDCLDVMRGMAAGSVDAVICDLPYGTTNCAWDSVIPFAPMWAELRRLVKPVGAIVLFGAQPFTSALVMSNPQWFKWADVWHKTQATGHLNAYVMPLREHEDLLVFGAGSVTYNPQFADKPQYNVRPPIRGGETNCYRAFDAQAPRTADNSLSFPRSVVRFANANNGERGCHPTQKPLSLLRYLIRTYTNRGDTVLDFTMGSGTTGVACRMEGRNFIGVELDPHYFAIAQRRIANAQPPLLLPDEPAVPQPEQAPMFGE